MRRKDRKIELGMKFVERRVDDNEHNEHSSDFNQGK